MELPDHLYTAQDMADYAREAVAASKGLLTELSGKQLPNESLIQEVRDALCSYSTDPYIYSLIKRIDEQQLPQAELSEEEIESIALEKRFWFSDEPNSFYWGKFARSVIAADRALRAQTKDKP